MSTATLLEEIAELEKKAEIIKQELSNNKDFKVPHSATKIEVETFQNEIPEVTTETNIFNEENQRIDYEKKVIMIGILGTQAHIGVTHTGIQIANILNANGHKVALAEFNNTGAFTHIKNYIEKEGTNKPYFEHTGIAFYPSSDLLILDNIFMTGCEFIIIDFGDFSHNNFKDLFLRCDIKVIVSGSKPWELQALDEIFSSIESTELKNYHYCFNFTPDYMMQRIETGMEALDNIYFLNYNNDPFNPTSINSGIEPLLKDFILEETIKPSRKSIFRRKNKK